MQKKLKKLIHIDKFIKKYGKQKWIKYLHKRLLLK